MIVRKTERVTEMAAGAVRRGGQRGPAGRTFGPRRCRVAGAMLGALAMAATVAPAAGQGRNWDGLFPGGDAPPTTRTEPLAVAYLAAPYVRGLKGPSATFRIGAETPGSSLFAKLTERDEKSWEGDLIELFRGRTTQPQDRLSVEGSVLSLGGRTPLSLRLYVFVPEARPVRISRVKVWDSDAWHEKPDEFSVLTDTSFQLEALPVIKGDLPTWSKGEIIACVNKRARPPVCSGDTGAIIEDPLSGQPSLLMEARGGPPEWLKKVPTEICVDRQKGHVVRVPESSQAIPLDQAVGDRWCSAILILNYVALREEGLRIGSLDSKRRLSSRFASDNDWRMWAERPKAIKVRAAREVWVQRIVLQPPVEAPPPRPSAPPSGFELLLASQEPPVGSIRKLWYGPIPGSAVGDARCEKQRLVWETASTGKDDLNRAQGVRTQGERRLKATEPDNARLVSLLKEPLAVIVEAANSKLYCGVAMPIPGRERAFRIALRPNQERVASPSKDETTKSTHALPVAPPPHAPPKKEPVAPPKAVVPPGPNVMVVFNSTNPAKELLKHGKVANEEGVFHSVDRQQLRFTLPPESGLAVFKCETKLLDCRIDGQDIEFLPKKGVSLPRQAKQVVVTVDFAPLETRADLTFQHKGPRDALLIFEQVSKAGTAELVKLKGGAPAEPKTVKWRRGDKIRVRPATDHDVHFHKIDEVEVDREKLPVADDKSVEIALTEATKAISVDTEHRLFSGKIRVSSPKGRAVVKFGSRPSPLDDTIGMTPGAKDVMLKDIKPGEPGHELRFEPFDSTRHEVGTAILSDGRTKTPLKDATLKLERKFFAKGELASLSVDIDLRVPSFTLADRFRLQPVVQIGRRGLLLRSCKVEFEDFLEGSKFTNKGGYTEVTLAQDRRAAKTRTYAVNVHRDAKVCSGLTIGQPIRAAQLKDLRQDATLAIPLRRPGSRAFVGVVNLSRDIRSKELNWRAALEALRDVFDAGAKEGKYLWGAIYGPQGQLLVTSGDTADYAPFDLDEVSSGSKMDSLTGGAGLPFGSLVTRVAKLKDVADLEGNVDALIVADEPFRKCGWSDPPFAQGSRAAFVRLTNSVSAGREIVSGVRVCESGDKGDRKSGDKSGVVAEIEIVPKEWSRGAENDVQLKKAIAEAAKGFTKTPSSQ